MVKWGRRLIGRGASKPTSSRRGKRSDNYKRREYYYSDRSSSQGSFDERNEEDSNGWDARDDDREARRGDYSDDNGREYRDDDGSTSELVTRDQVIDELRAQAAAEALGKSLEQMGYNLDNCDSFYSLSENDDDVNQRYKITQRANSEVSKNVGASKNQKKKRVKSKKRNSKPTRTRDDYTDASSAYYGTVAGANHHSFGDYETYADSTSEVTGDSYDEDETTFATGRDTELTSRYTRFTRKKSARNRKAVNARKHKKHARDQDTYYTRETEWTDGDSRYAESLDHNSTLTSMSLSEDSEADLNSDYSEPTRKRDRLLKKETPRRTKNDKKQRNMKAVKEEPTEDGVSDDSSSEMEEQYEKKLTKKSNVIRRHGRGDSSLRSNSSQIGAMRSLDSFSDVGTVVERYNEKVEESVERSQKMKAAKKAQDSKKNRKSEEHTEKKKNEKTSEKKKPAGRVKNHSKVKNTKSEEGFASESGAEAEGSSNSVDAEDKTQKSSRSKKSTRTQKSFRSKAKSLNDSNEDAHGERRNLDGKDVRKRIADASKEKSNKNGNDEDSDDDSEQGKSKSPKHQRESSSNRSQAKPRKGKPSRANKGVHEKKNEGNDDEDGEAREEEAQQVEETKKTSSKKTKVTSGASQLDPSKKFWSRQFLSLRKRKNDENSEELKETGGNGEERGVTDGGNVANEDIKEDEMKAKQRCGPNPDTDENCSSGGENVSPDSSEKDATSQKTSSQKKRIHDKMAHSKTDDKQSHEKVADLPDCGISSTPKASKESEKGTQKKTQKEKQATSMGVYEIAAMAAMIPLAPLAAAYSCYTADRTQSFIANGAACGGYNCNELPVRKKTVSEYKKDKDDDVFSRASSKKRRSKSKKQVPNKVAGEKSPLEATAKKEAVENGRKESSAALKESIKASKPYGEGTTSRSKKAFTKILPQRTPKHELPKKTHVDKTHIEEAPEGFESFLPGPLDMQCLSMSETATLANEAKMLPSAASVSSVSKSQKLQDSSDSRVPRKKNRRWLPKLPFSNGNRRGDVKEDALSEQDMQKEPDHIQQNGRAAQGKSSDRIPFLKSGQGGPILENPSTRALPSFWETPTFAPPQRRVAIGELVGSPHSTARHGQFVPFSCTRDSTVCGGAEEVDDREMDQSLLSDFENIALDALRKKSQKEAQINGAGFDPSNATQEDLLKYYDLGQTLSDVVDARQTLEQAYGINAGGNSFDHTIDEQLVELLTHMAEMDQDDVVEIEAAIKKLKRHARKLGVSERDLLYSVKSAEGSTLSPRNEYLRPENNPSYNDKMIDAFEGYFAR